MQTENNLLPCAHCGSTNIDPAEWSGNNGKSGPGCGDCGALADSAESWNRRAALVALPPEQIADLASRCGVKGSAAALAEFATLVREAEPLDPDEIRPKAIAPTVPTITLSGHQLRMALDLINPDGPSDDLQMDDELTFGIVQHKDDDGKAATGMCCWNVDTDGVLPLDGEYSAPAASADAIKSMATLLANREWAEDLSLTGDLADLQGQITELVGRANAPAVEQSAEKVATDGWGGLCESIITMQPSSDKHIEFKKGYDAACMAAAELARLDAIASRRTTGGDVVGVAVEWANGKVDLVCGEPKPEALDHWLKCGATVRSLRVDVTAPVSASRTPTGETTGGNVRALLQEICDMQAANYGDGMGTHLALMGLCDKARKALAAPVSAGQGVQVAMPEHSRDLDVFRYVFDRAEQEMKGTLKMLRRDLFAAPVTPEQSDTPPDSPPPAAQDGAVPEQMTRYTGKQISLIHSWETEEFVPVGDLVLRSLLAAQPAEGSAQVATESLRGLVAPERSDTPAGLTAAARNVLAERHRQVEQEGWTPEHDQQYDGGELSLAASCYALAGDGPHASLPEDWPWNSDWWKPADDRRNLVKAGALILADIERLDRARIDGDKQGAQGDGK